MTVYKNMSFIDRIYVELFAMWCRIQRRLYIFPVPNRRMTTLMPYIRAYVPQNARINTDGYGGYRQLARE